MSAALIAVLLVATLPLALLAAAMPTVANGQSAPRQKVSDRFTSQIPNASTGRAYDLEFFDPDNPEGKPHALRHVFVELHPGARFDTTALTQCAATDAELTARGADACPADSRLGTSVVVIDTGFPGPNRFITADLVFLNNQDELILLSTERGTGARVILRGRLMENTLAIEVPPLPGTPPEGGANRTETAVQNEASTIRDGRRVAWLTTPPDCPPSRHWTNRVTYTYADGVVQTATSTSPCVRRSASDRRKPRVRLKGVPRGGCTSRSFTARVSAKDESGLTRTRLYLDGRRLRQTGGTDLSKRIPARNLSGGSHRITASATDRAGNHARTTARFKRC